MHKKGNIQMDILNNILWMLKQKGIPQKELSSFLGLSPNIFTNWKSGSNRSYIKYKDSIAKFFDVPSDILCSEDIETDYEMYKRGIDSLGAMAVGSISMLPVYGSVSAGTGVLAEDQIVGYEPAFDVSKPNEYFYLRVHGDSMKPKLMDGDTVLCHKQESVEPGEIAVLLVDGEDGVVKRVDYDENSITLLSFNPFYPPRVFEGSDVRRVSVLAKVVMMMRRF